VSNKDNKDFESLYYSRGMRSMPVNFDYVLLPVLSERKGIFIFPIMYIFELAFFSHLKIIILDPALPSACHFPVRATGIEIEA
jgi:hypothetical protein